MWCVCLLSIPKDTTKLYSLMTEAHRCKQLAQNYYAVVRGWEPNKSNSGVLRSTDCATIPPDIDDESDSIALSRSLPRTERPVLRAHYCLQPWQSVSVQSEWQESRYRQLLQPCTSTCQLSCVLAVTATRSLPASLSPVVVVAD